MFTLMLSIALSAASSDASTTPAPPTEVAAKPVKPKKICRAGGATGSRLTSKICKTQTEWDAQLGADAEKLDGKRDSGSY